MIKGFKRATEVGHAPTCLMTLDSCSGDQRLESSSLVEVPLKPKVILIWVLIRVLIRVLPPPHHHF